MPNKDELKSLLAEIFADGVARTKTSASGTPSLPYYHGPGGIFGVEGLERDVISTRVHPIGLASMLPALPSVQMNPLFPYLPGFLDGSGDNPDGVCDDSPTAGPAKTCIQTAQFGRYSVSTRELEVNRVGQKIDRAEFFDLQFVNDPLADSLGGSLAQGILGMSLPSAQSMLLGREVLARMVEVGVSIQNWLAPRVYTGNPTNNTAGGGYQEFPGLDILIGTNKVDALTGTDCPSLDSLIMDFNYQSVLDSDPQSVVRVLAEIMRQLRHNASRMGFGDTRWVIVGRESLFYALTSIWPCQYMFDRCNPSGSNQDISLDAQTYIQMRDSMRNNQYLLVDGVQIPYIVDDAIPEDNNGTNGLIPSGSFASDLYIIPLTVRSGTPVTFWQYYDYNQGVMQAIGDGRVGHMFWTDGGRYLWTYDVKNWCLIHTVKFEPRLILKTPHLAARFLNLMYAPLIHEREPFPTQPYFVDGGATSREAPSLYSDWNPR